MPPVLQHLGLPRGGYKVANLSVNRTARKLRLRVPYALRRPVTANVGPYGLGSCQCVDEHSGFRLHPLKGASKSRWSISVNGNWRITFEFKDGNAYVLDYEDYHR